ncbi:MAG: hypothetical protein [Bacteriophage sp.]|nr:MAG: hypothetical protein [Bacteriophage sp.]
MKHQKTVDTYTCDCCGAEIVAKARLAADFMNNLFEAIETREDLITSLELESENYIPNHLSKTVLLHSIRIERSMLLELYKMVEDDDK